MSARRAGARPRAAALLLVISLLAIGSPRAGAQEPQIPDPVGFVNDAAGVIDEPTRAKLEGFLDQVKKKTGADFAVLTVRTTAPLSPTDYKVRVFERWKLGRRGEDDGLLMLVAIEEREVRFETGYGLEGPLPDGLQSRIVRERMAPRFQAGDYAGGIVAGVQACAVRIAAERNVTLEWDGRELRYDRGRRSDVPWWVVVLMVVLFWFVVSRISRSGGGWQGPRRGGGWMMGGGGFGGWGGGFGGGSFGGGGFGGGGGGSFGGFGGGTSGGGGGGGRW